MGNLVVAKLYRLGRDGDKVKEEYKTELRSRVIIDSDELEVFNSGKSVSGQMYVVDEIATKQRNEDVKQKAEEKQLLIETKKAASKLAADVITTAIEGAKKGRPAKDKTEKTE